MPKQQLTNEIINAAIEGFMAQRQRLDDQIGELRAMLSGGSAEPGATTETKRGRRKMSAAGRARIAEAQRKRWAAAKKQPVATESPKRRRKLSVAGRKAISEATKRRWALKRAATQENAQPAAKKKAATKKSTVKRPQKQAPNIPAAKSATE